MHMTNSCARTLVGFSGISRLAVQAVGPVLPAVLAKLYKCSGRNTCGCHTGRSPQQHPLWAQVQTLTTVTSTAQQQPATQLNFDNYEAVFSGRPLSDLLRAYVVLKVCTFSPLVRNSEALVSASRKILGDKITFGIIRKTFFKQFCAGEQEAEIWPTMNMLRAHGIRAIIDYAAEDDVPPAAKHSSSASAPSSTAATTDGAGASPASSSSISSSGGAGVAPVRYKSQQEVVGRTYDYQSEAKCDHHVDIFLKAIDTVGKLEGNGFAAIKMTALGNPQLLERMSSALLEIRDWFRLGDTDGDGFVTKQEFSGLYRRVFPSATPDLVDRAFHTLDLEGQGQVDIISWTHRIRLQDMPRMVELIRKHGGGGSDPLAADVMSVSLTEEEVGLVEAMMRRIGRLAEAAAAQGVRLMVDAEHTYFQPAIDHTVKALSLQYNKGPNAPVIFNTYQAYLKGSKQLVLEDMERARREKYIFAAKLVRGAYMQLERRRAAAKGYPSPVWDTIEDTHRNYDSCVDVILDEVASHQAQLMVASHNQTSIEHTVAGLAARKLGPKGSGVYFGQLLGMADNLTFTLGQHGYEAFKYVPYGPIELVMPYLVRRAQENSAIMGAGVGRQIKMVRQEILRRLTKSA